MGKVLISHLLIMVDNSYTLYDFRKILSNLYVIFDNLHKEYQREFINALGHNNFKQIFNKGEFDVDKFAITKYNEYFYCIIDESKVNKYIILNSDHLHRIRNNLTFLFNKQLEEKIGLN